MSKEEIVRKMIDRDIYANADTMVERLRESNVPQWANAVLPLFNQVDYSVPPQGYEIHSTDGAFYWDRPGARYMVDDEVESSNEVYATEHAAIVAAWEYDGNQPDSRIDAVRFWLVSEWLAYRLEQVGALVARDVMGFSIWGQTHLSSDLDLSAVADLVGG